MLPTQLSRADKPGSDAVVFGDAPILLLHHVKRLERASDPLGVGGLMLLARSRQPCSLLLTHGEEETGLVCSSQGHFAAWSSW